MGRHSAGGSPATSSSSSSNGNTRNTSSSSRHAASGQTSRDAAQLASTATAVNREVRRHPQGKGAKPSTTRKAVGGAAAGAATGAAVGSVVPGVGTAIGAGAGAVIGGAGGAMRGHSEKKAWKAANRGPGTRALLAEFLLCLVVVALSPSVRPKGEVTPGAWMKRGSAVCALFILLGMLASVGDRSSRVAVAVGGLVTLGLAVSEREVIGSLLQRFGPGQSAGGVDLGGDGGGDGGTDPRPPPDAPVDPDDRTGRRPPPDAPIRPARFA